MTASQKLKQKLLHLATDVVFPPEEIADRWLEYRGELSEVMSDFRYGEENTDIPSEWSRHYESRSVAAEMLDGSYVGWTFWYGGGKYGEPYSIEWVEDAYDVTFVEETVVVKKFSRVA